MTIKEMRAYLGEEDKPLSKAAFSRIYKIPIRTLEDWEAGKRTPPEYVIYLLERAVKYDKENDNLLRITVRRQIEEMETAKTENDIINNRFL